MSDLDSINLFNGRVNVHLPLFKLAGRGGAKSDVSFTIDSPFPYRTGIYDDGNANPYQFVEPGMTSDGLHLGQYGLRYETSGEMPLWTGEFSNYFKWTRSVTRVFLIAPDGTEIAMRDLATGGQPLSDAPYSPNGPPYAGPSRGKIFVATDGSGATLIFDAEVRDTVAAEWPPIGIDDSWLLLKDGRRIRFGLLGKASTDTDRNGNKIIWGQSYPGTNTDSLNRKTYQEAAANLEQCVTLFGGDSRACEAVVQRGFNGAERKIWMSYNEQLRPSAILLPNGQRYSFFYNQYGDLTRVDLPTGGSIEYDYEPGLEDSVSYCGLWHTPCMPGTYADFVYNRVTARRVYREGHVLESRQTFSKPGGNGANVGYVDRKNFDSNDHLLSTDRHFFYGTAEASFAVKGVDYVSWKAGREYRSEFYDGSGNLLRRTETTWAQRDGGVYWWPGNQDDAPENDPRVVATVTYLENGQSNGTAFVYDPTVPYNSLTDVYNYDFNGALLRHSQTAYLKVLNGVDYTGSNIQNAAAPHLRDFPLQVRVFDGIKEFSRTIYEYDNYITDTNHAGLDVFPRPNISGLDATFTSSYYTRGNVTGITNYLLDDNAQVIGSTSSYSQYDIAGNVVKTIDPRGFSTTLFYDDHFGAPDAEARGNTVPSELSTPVPAQSSYAFVTKATNALGHTMYSQYDFYLGQAVDVEDATGVVGVEDGRGVVSSLYFDDVLDRQTRMIQGFNRGAPIKNKAEVSYDDANRTVTVNGDLTAYGDGKLKSKSFYDGLGRKIETRTYENSTQYIAVKVVPFLVMEDPETGGWVQASQLSNSYRPSLGEQPVWSTSFMDSLGRISKLQTPDTAIVRSYYDGARTLVVDQVGKERLSYSNALGQITHIWEITSADSETEAVSFPGRAEVTAGYHSIYEYDAVSHLIKVTQGTQPQRTFTYDTLGRFHHREYLQRSRSIDSNKATPGSRGSELCPSGYDFHL